MNTHADNYEPKITTIHDFLNEISNKEPLVKLTSNGVELMDGEYVIGLQRIEGPLSLVKWILQLSEKSWVTTTHIQEFIEIVCEAKGWESRGL